MHAGEKAKPGAKKKNKQGKKAKTVKKPKSTAVVPVPAGVGDDGPRAVPDGVSDDGPRAAMPVSDPTEKPHLKRKGVLA